MPEAVKNITTVDKKLGSALVRVCQTKRERINGWHQPKTTVIVARFR
jgi:hypothetical protein